MEVVKADNEAAFEELTVTDGQNVYDPETEVDVHAVIVGVKDDATVTDGEFVRLTVTVADCDGETVNVGDVDCDTLTVALTVDVGDALYEEDTEVEADEPPLDDAAPDAVAQTDADALGDAAALCEVVSECVTEIDGEMEGVDEPVNE